MHFLHTDILKLKGRIQLKPDAIPVYFNCVDDDSFPKSDPINDFQNIEDNQCFNERDICSKCDMLSKDLDELKKKLYKTKIDSDFELMKRNIKIDELIGKCDEQALKISGLKQQISTLEKNLNDSEYQIKDLNFQMGRVPKTEVNF